MFNYQGCTEFGWFITSDYSANGTQIFGNYFSSDFFIQQCKDTFGPNFDMKEVQTAVERSNAKYGGISLANLTNVVFVNGLIDPWHELSVLKESSKNPSVTAIVIPETAHCIDMVAKTQNDPPSLSKAREQITKAIGQFLGVN